jgi:hypothetical protein
MELRAVDTGARRRDAQDMEWLTDRVGRLSEPGMAWHARAAVCAGRT